MQQPQISGWQFFRPQFEYQAAFDDFDFPWRGHIYFAYDLIRYFRPERVYELGTWKGTSLFSIAQAVKDASLNTQIFAVDSWAGDEHVGHYGDEVYDSVVKLTRVFYGRQQLRLLRQTFDEAVLNVPDGSIDLLHIDGLHTYEAVRHDYDTWKNKVSREGVILFHDTNVADFGVWKLWEEIRKEDPGAFCMSFDHSHGLGVLIRSPDTQRELRRIGPDALRSHYERLADQVLLSRLQEEFHRLQGQANEVHHLRSGAIRQGAALGERVAQLNELEERFHALVREVQQYEKKLNVKLTRLEERRQVAKEKADSRLLEMEMLRKLIVWKLMKPFLNLEKSLRKRKLRRASNHTLSEISPAEKITKAGDTPVHVPFPWHKHRTPE